MKLAARARSAHTAHFNSSGRKYETNRNYVIWITRFDRVLTRPIPIRQYSSIDDLDQFVLPTVELLIPRRIAGMQDDNRNTRTSSDLPSRCAVCGTSLEPEDWHPTETVIDDDEVKKLLVFCDEECHSKWENQQPRHSVD